MQTIPTHAWVAYEDRFGLQLGPHAYAQDFLTEEEANDFREKSNMSIKIAKLKFKANKQYYPEYYENIDYRKDA